MIPLSSSCLLLILNQCLKCRFPVNTIAIPAASQARILSSSRTDPPGCIIAVTPAAAARRTQSSKGKKASLPITLPAALSFAYSSAMRAAVTRPVCPGPTPVVAPDFASAIPLLLTCFTTRHTNLKSSSSCFIVESFIRNKF